MTRELLYDRLMEDHYDDAENQLAEYKKHKDELAGMFAAGVKGADPAVVLIRMFGDDVRGALG